MGGLEILSTRVGMKKILDFNFEGGVFSTRAEPKNQTLRSAKWRYCQRSGLWYTGSYVAASRLRDLMEGSARDELKRKTLTIAPWPGKPPHPPHETPLKFQPNAARFVLARNNSYLAAEPGLGKTIMAMLVFNALMEATDDGWAFIYMCPPFMVANVIEEFEKWKFRKHHRCIRHNVGWPIPTDMVVFPDSMIARSEDVREIEDFCEEAHRAGKKTMLFVDEAQRFGGMESMRTEALFGYQDKNVKNVFNMKIKHPGVADLFDKRCYMSGTPVQSKNLELFPLLNHSAPETIDHMNLYQFGRRYCGLKRNGYGVEFTASTRSEELAARIKPRFMLRLRKKLLNLPPKLEELLFVSDDLPPRLASMDKEILKHYSPQDLMEAEMKKKHGIEGDLHLATYRKLLGVEKIRPSVQVINSILENSDENLLVFALHIDVTEGLAEKLKQHKPILINGKVPVDKRFQLCKKFQASKDRRLLIGNIDACGLGFTLTKATRVLIVEPSYVPSKNDQASDRAHRHGQKDSVYVQFLVYRNSVDRKVMETIFRKKKQTQHI